MVYRGKLEDSPRNSEGQVVVGACRCKMIRHHTERNDSQFTVAPPQHFFDFLPDPHGTLRRRLGQLSYCNFPYSALACFRMGMSGSASFQRLRKS
jgi:hypothetical protein